MEKSASESRLVLPPWYTEPKFTRRGVVVKSGALAVWLLAGCSGISSPSSTPIPFPTPQSEYTPIIRFSNPADPSTGDATYPYPPGFFKRNPQDPSIYTDPKLDFRLQVFSNIIGDWLFFNVEIGRKSKSTTEGGWEGGMRGLDLELPHTLFMRWQDFTFTENFLDGRRLGPETKPASISQVTAFLIHKVPGYWT